MTSDEKLNELRLRFRAYFTEFISKKDFNQQDAINEIKKICEKKIRVLKSNLIEKNKKRNESLENEKDCQEYRKQIVSNFDCDAIREYILDEKGSSDQIKKKFDKEFNKSKIDALLNFMYGLKGSHAPSKDISAMCLGKNGFNDFMNNFESLPNVEKNNSVKHSPKKEKFINYFFKHDCYLYAYSEDIGLPEESTSYKDINLPKIDAIVLKYDSISKHFSIDNVKKRVKHGYGVINWVGTKNNEAFDINFPNSKKALFLRFHAANYKSVRTKFNTLLGSFSLVDNDTGNVVIGSVVLQNFNHLVEDENEPIKLAPYSYNFSFTDNHIEKIESPDKIIIKPPIEVKTYLFDRYRNWMKIKGGIYNMNKFKVWINDKEKKEYIRRRITENEYLITYPVTSLEPEDVEFKKNFVDDLNSTLFNFKENHFVSNALTKYITKDKEHLNDLPSLVGKISDNLEKIKDRIEIFPLSNEYIQTENHVNLNKALFEQINKSISVVIIIPNGNYIKKSSVYTIAGYAMALRKKTFILHQNRKDLPLVIRKDIDTMGLYVWEYEDIKELPFYFHYRNRNNLRF